MPQRISNDPCERVPRPRNLAWPPRSKKMGLGTGLRQSQPRQPLQRTRCCVQINVLGNWGNGSAARKQWCLDGAVLARVCCPTVL